MAKPWCWFSVPQNVLFIGMVNDGLGLGETGLLGSIYSFVIDSLQDPGQAI